MKKFFIYLWNRIKKIPWYGWVIMGILYALNTIAYTSATAIVLKYTSHWYSVDAQITWFDKAIPLIPIFWMQVYMLWFPLFFVGPLIASAGDKRNYLNLVFAWIAAQLIGWMMFIFVPSYMDRWNVAGNGQAAFNMMALAETKGGWSWGILRWVMNHDNGRMNWIMMPSFHCVNITFCYFGVMRRKDVHLAHRIGWMIISIMIALACVFTKQHYVIDILLAWLLCVICFFSFKVFDPAKHILKKCPNFLIIEKLNWNHEKIYRNVKKTKIQNESNKSKKDTQSV